MQRSERIVLTFVAVAWLMVAGTGVAVHEPWWDEAQAWLLARDAPVADLFSGLLAYEGHPPLWYLILAIPAKLGFPYKTINIISALIAAAGVSILLRLRGVPLLLRATLPFTFFLAYQYTVVARSYVLIPLLLAAIAALYERREQRLLSFAVLLALLSQVSVYGACLAGGFVALFCYDLWRRRLRASQIPISNLAAAALLLAASFVTLIVVLWPRADLTSGGQVDLSFSAPKMARIAMRVMTETLVGHSDSAFAIAAAAVLSAVLLFWFYRRGVLAEFVLLFTSMLPIASMYFARWHEGLFFWVVVFVLLIRHRAMQETPMMAKAGWCVVAVMIAAHLMWTAQSLAFDVQRPYTGSREAARFIAAHQLEQTRLFGAGIRCIEVQPYFPHNIFANYTGPGGGAFWDWSGTDPWPYPAPVPNPPRMMQWLSRQIAARPDYCLASAGFRAEGLYGEALRRRNDYREVARFKGGLFWKDGVIERIDFALFQRIDARPRP